jgi:hypothetical protein
MFERFDARVRLVLELAGNRRAIIERKRRRVKFPTGVRVTLGDLREVLALFDGAGWAGGFTDAAMRRLERLRDTEGEVTLDDLREALRR